MASIGFISEGQEILVAMPPEALLLPQNTGTDTALIDVFDDERGQLFWNYLYPRNRELTITEGGKLHSYAYYENLSGDTPALQSLPRIANSYHDVLGYEAFSVDLLRSMTRIILISDWNRLQAPVKLWALKTTQLPRLLKWPLCMFNL